METIKQNNENEVRLFFSRIHHSFNGIFEAANYNFVYRIRFAGLVMIVFFIYVWKTRMLKSFDNEFQSDNEFHKLIKNPRL